MRRRPIVLAIVLVGAVGVWMLLVPEAERAYNRIRLGMTLSEVEEAIGLPPWEPTPSTLPTRVLVRETGIPWATHDYGLPSALWLEWRDYMIEVTFDESGKTVGFYLFRSPNFLDGVRWKLGL